MPDLFLIVSAKDAEILQTHIKTVIGPALRQATADALPDLEGDPKEVVVWIIAHAGGDNIPPLQILGVGSWLEERDPYLETWRKALSDAWWKIMYTKEMFPYLSLFSPSEVEIFPTMPKGDWGLARPKFNRLTV